MADQDPGSKHKKKLIDFPPRSLLDALIHSFPKEWRGVFALLNSEHLPVQAASFWLQSKCANERLSDIPPDWKDFLDHLVSDFPVVLNDKLFFKPKILLLPLNIQSNTMAFIAYHSCSVPVESLDKLVHSLHIFAAEIDGWRLTHLKILESKARNLKELESVDSQDWKKSDHKENNLHCTDLMTEESKARFEDLVEKNKLAESSGNIPWFSSVLESEMRSEDNTNNWGISEQCVPPFRGKYGDQDDIIMVDLTGTCTHDVVVQSDNTLEDIYPGSSDVYDDSDIEIIKVIENPAKQVKLEPDSVVIAELTVVPLPPEHLIIENEHVPEHLITGENPTAEQNLSDALQLKISTLQNLLQSSEANELDLSNELELFSSCSTQEMEFICTQLNLKVMEECLAISLCQQFVTLPTEPSFSNTSIFAAHCLLPQIQGLKQTASRVLFSAVSQFARKHSRAFCDGVIITLVQQSNLDTPQVDLINKVIKECLTEDTRVHLLQLVFSVKSDTDGCPFSWTECTVSIVQVLVDFKPELNGDLFGTLVSVLEQQSRHLSKSLKFAKMLLAVIKMYGQQVSLHLNSFVHILEGNETFLKKAGLSALKKTTKN